MADRDSENGAWPMTQGSTALPPLWLDSRTTFVGRRRELAELEGLLDERRRLVTLSGAGGVGKTRLALRVAALRAEPGRFYFADLSPVTRGSQVARALLEAITPTVRPGGSEVDAVVGRLGDHPALVLLDNCEHIVDAAGELARTLLRRCPRVTVIATSTEPLGIRGETVWQVPPLDVANSDGSQVSDAVALFVDRARMALRNIEFPGQSVDTIDRIVRRLDGMPLAIELAAARVRMLSLDDIAATLDLRLLAGGPRTGPPRQATTRRSLDWCHGFLSGPEQALFRRLSVFEGGWTADAAAAVCRDDSVPDDAVPRLLAGLAHKSLVVEAEVGGQARYRMLMPIRAYALETLAEHDRDGPEARAEADWLRTRHLEYYLGFAQLGCWQLAPFREETRARIDAEAANLLAAAGEACRRRSVKALELVAALGLYWRVCGRLSEGLDVTARALAAVPSEPHPARAMALAVQSMLMCWLGDIPGSLAAGRQGAAMGAEVGNDAARAMALVHMANSSAILSPPEALPALREAAELAWEAEDRFTACDALAGTTMALMWQDDYKAMESVADTTKKVADDIGFAGVLSQTLWCQAHHALAKGDFADAAELARESLPRAMTVGPESDDNSVETLCRNCATQILVLVDTARGDARRGRARAEAELQRSLVDPVRWGTGLLLAAHGTACLHLGDLAAARASASRLHDQERTGSASLAWQAQDILMHVALEAGDIDAARRHVQEILRIADALDNGRARARARAGLARAHLAAADPGSAEMEAQAAADACAAQGWYLDALDVLDVLARVAAERGQLSRAARLIAAADRNRRVIGAVRPPTAADRWDRLGAVVATHLSADERAEAVAAGQAMDVVEAIGDARRSRGRGVRPSRGRASLTPMEQRVARLAADGMPNTEIAARLFIARATVKVHLSHIYAKLGVANRVQLAAAYRAHGSP